MSWTCDIATNSSRQLRLAVPRTYEPEQRRVIVTVGRAQSADIAVPDFPGCHEITSSPIERFCYVLELPLIELALSRDMRRNQPRCIVRVERRRAWRVFEIQSHSFLGFPARSFRTTRSFWRCSSRSLIDCASSFMECDTGITSESAIFFARSRCISSSGFSGTRA